MNTTFIKWLCCLLLVLSGIQPAEAAIGARSAGGRQPVGCLPPAASGLGAVLVFNGLADGSLYFECDAPEECQWRRSDAALQGEAVRAEAGASALTALQPNTIYIVSYRGKEEACYVIDYQDYPLQYGSLEPVTDAIDIGESLQIVLTSCSDDLQYQGLNGRTYTLQREHLLSYTDAVWDEASAAWHDEEKQVTKSGYVSSFVIDAPQQDVQFVLQGDQFLRAWNLPLAESVCNYEAACVDLRSVARLLKTEEEGSSLTGSAPLEVAFYSHANPATDYCIWYIYTTPGSEQDYLYRNGQDIEHTFYQSGTFKVKLVASSQQCKDSTVFSITVTESSLDCPNFFTPRSTPGENDLFRVSYESLISFHGKILNRWGNLLFEWDDPDEGWDGTYKGQAVSPGVYFYIITAKGSDGIEYVKRGDINLIE